MESIDLWLDDRRDPNSPETQQIYGSKPGMTWAKTAQEAISILASGNVRSISFDHDLGPRELVGDGHQVANYIERQAYDGTLPRLQWRVHSDNGVGRDNIIRAMTSAERFWDR